MLFIIHTWSTLLVVLAFLLGWIPQSMSYNFVFNFKLREKWTDVGKELRSMTFLPQFFRSITCSLQCKETCGLTVLLGLFCQAGTSCEIHLAVFRQGNQQLCNVYLFSVPMQSHHKMLPNKKGVNLYSLPISVSDNIWCEAVEKLGLLKN